MGWLSNILKSTSAQDQRGEVIAGIGLTNLLTSRKRVVTDAQLIDRFCGTAFTCATINAEACASTPIILMMRKKSSGGFQRKTISEATFKRMQQDPRARRWLAEKKIGDVTEVFDHPILDVLESVNPVMDGFELQVYTQLTLDIVGRAYWWLEIEGQTVKNIWPLAPQFVRIEYDRVTGQVINYKYGFNAQERDYPPEEIVVFRRTSVKDPYREETSPTLAVMDEIDFAGLDVRMANVLLQNRSHPDMILTPEKMGMGATAVQRFKYRLAEMFRRGTAGSIAVSGIPLKAIPLNTTSREMQSDKRYKQVKVSTANAYGVPIALLEGESINRSTLETALIQHARMAVIPRMTRLVQRLNQTFVPVFGDDNLFLWYDAPVLEDEEMRSKIRRSDLEVGVTTINEVRETMEHAPVDWGDEPWLPSQLSQPSDEPVEIEPIAVPAPPPEETIPEVKGMVNVDAIASAITCDDVISLGRSDDRYFVTTVKRLERDGRLDSDVAVSWATLLHATDIPPEPERIKRGHVNSALGKKGHSRSMPRGSSIAAAVRSVARAQRKVVVSSLVKVSLRRPGFWKTKQVSSDFDLSSWDEDLAKRGREGIEADFMRGVDETWKTVSSASKGKGETKTKQGTLVLTVDEALTVTDPGVKKAIDEAALKFAESTNATTSLGLSEATAKLRLELAAGLIEQGEALPELVKRVNAVFDMAETWRAERVALTESSRALHSGQKMMAEESGVVKGFKWLLSADPCPICIAIESKFKGGIGLNADFGNQTDYGQSPSETYGVIVHPPAHPYCMCTLIEVLKEQL